MIIFKSGKISKNEEKLVLNILNESQDLYGDNYITRANLRLFLKENPGLLFQGLQKGDKLFYEEDEGLIFVDGYSDKSPRKYIKIITKTEDSANRLLKTLQWHIKEDLFCKIKKNNPIKRVLERNGFRFCGDRGKELLVCRKFFSSRPVTPKEEINAE